MLTIGSIAPDLELFATPDQKLKLSELGIRDKILPGDMKEIMYQVLMAKKKAQANAFMRREETASTGAC